MSLLLIYGYRFKPRWVNNSMDNYWGVQLAHYFCESYIKLRLLDYGYNQFYSTVILVLVNYHLFLKQFLNWMAVNTMHSSVHLPSWHPNTRHSWCVRESYKTLWWELLPSHHTMNCILWQTDKVKYIKKANSGIIFYMWIPNNHVSLIINCYSPWNL